jgi:hypothetical protein
MLNVGLEQQQQIRGANGDLLWSGGQVIATDYIAKSGEAANSFAMGEAALWNPATVAVGFIPRQETTVAPAAPAADLPGTLVLGMKRTSAATAGTEVCFMGVVQEPVGPGKLGLVAGPGSLTTVKVEVGAIALGAAIGSSGVIGTVTTHAARSATVPAYGTVLGHCFKINTAGATGTGSTSWAGVLVNPY